ncbi:hypothetical protein Ciccas_010504 [Cichlidogyrus casuarinus]|uniref:Carboxylic ester hydrolase n=1 Tax=Cichlidogyrus casuarinus TaxID=1844966 RepID=A0ABD2PUA7_9PLAT
MLDRHITTKQSHGNRTNSTYHPKVVMSNQKEILAFLGIPYAKAPSNDKRFAPAEELDTLPQELICIEFDSCPYQSRDVEPIRDRNWTPDYSLMSENCLKLNIWTPTSEAAASLKPVLFWIYGGGFCKGAASLPIYDGTHLAAKLDCVVVTADYRLGPLGFLCLPEIGIPGNMGISDQKAALKWVFQNIRFFGGDPEKVLVFGESAGAVSGSMLLFDRDCEPQFKSLFLQSGCLFCPTLVATRAEMIARSKQLISLFGIDLTDPERARAELNRMEPEKFFTDNMSFARGPCNFTWGPWLDNSMFDHLARGKQLFFMLTSNEGSCWLLDSLPMLDQNQNLIDFQDCMKQVAAFFPSWPCRPDQQQIGPLLDEYRSAEKSTVENASEFLSDWLFNYPMFAFSDYLSRNGIESRGLLYDYRNPNSPYPVWAGVVHGDEVAHIFQSSPVPATCDAFLDVFQFMLDSNAKLNWPKFELDNGIMLRLTDKSKLDSVSFLPKDQRRITLWQQTLPPATIF